MIGALSYTLLEKLGLRNALLIMLVVPFMMAVSYVLKYSVYACNNFIILRFWLILKKPTDKHDVVLEVQKSVNREELKDPKKAFLRKLKLIPSLMQYMIPLGLVYLFEYFINQGTVSHLTFNATVKVLPV